jgi:hypothetical protein
VILYHLLIMLYRDIESLEVQLVGISWGSINEISIVQVPSLPNIESFKKEKEKKSESLTTSILTGRLS